MDQELAARVRANPKFRALVTRRSRFSWTLAALMLVVFFGYVSVIAFDKALFARPIGGGVISLGIPVGLGVIVVTIVLTAAYVVRANAEFDRLTREIVEEAKR